jgi:hypothetical protein
VTAVTVGSGQAGGRSSRRDLGRLAARILRVEIRHSAFVWVIPLIAVLFIYDPLRTAAGYPALWPLRSTVVLNKFWPDLVVFAAGFSAWSGSREGRRNVDDLLGTTVRPAWTRQLCSLAGTAFWVAAAFLAGVIVLYVRTSQAATWGGPPVWPVVVGVIGMISVCAVGFTLGALFPGRFTAPIVAVALTIITLFAFRESVNASGGPVGVLSPDGAVPNNDWGIFYRASVGVPLVQVMFLGGAALAALGLLGVSPRTGGAGWRGALSAASAGGARLRAIALSVFAVGVALAVTGFGLAGTATGSTGGGSFSIHAIDDHLSGSGPVPYTPACATGSGGVQVCVHPAFRPYLSQIAAALRPVTAELAGLAGTPTAAREVPLSALPAAVLAGNGVGQVTGGVYRFTLADALPLTPDASYLKDAIQPDVVHAVIVGSLPGTMVTLPDGSQKFQPDFGTPAQQAVMDGILKTLGSPAYPTGGPGPAGQRSQQDEAPIASAAARFAVLPAATRHAWLAANLPALNAGTITLARLP